MESTLIQDIGQFFHDKTVGRKRITGVARHRRIHLISEILSAVVGALGVLASLILVFFYPVWLFLTIPVTIILTTVMVSFANWYWKKYLW